MKRTEAISALKKVKSLFKFNGTFRDDTRAEACEAIDMAIEALMHTKAEAEWIPCSERLPGKNQEVLLQCYHNMIVGYWMDGDFDGEKEWRVLSGDGWESGCDFPNDVFEPLAWMPLPKPYKGGDTDVD